MIPTHLLFSCTQYTQYAHVINSYVDITYLTHFSTLLWFLSPALLKNLNLGQHFVLHQLDPTADGGGLRLGTGDPQGRVILQVVAVLGVESPGGHGVGTLGRQEVFLRHDGGAGGGAGHLPVVVEVVIVGHGADTQPEVAAGVDWAVVHTFVTRLRPLPWRMRST